MLHGLDLSGDFQNVTSFHSVQAAGNSFVVVKATQGAHFRAGRFVEYAIRVRKTPGLTFGAYHFTDWHVDGKTQAANFLAAYKPAAGDLVPMIDVEAFAADRDTTTRIITDLLQGVEDGLAAAGLTLPDGSRAKCLFYTYWSGIVEQKFSADWFTDWPLWLAAYNNDATIEPPAGTWDAVTIWQWSNGSGQPPVPGIAERPVDRDRFFGTADDLAALTLASS